jgi:hypothetical protein
MRYIYIFLLLFFGTSLFAQNYVMTWQHCYGGTERDWVRSIIPYKDGSLFFGYSRSNDGDISDPTNTSCAWLVNIDQFGEIVFDSCYKGVAGSGASGTKLMKSDTAFYFVGSSTQYTNNGLMQGYWLAHLDTNFNVVWQDVLGGSYAEDSRGGCIAHDGGVIESGITGSPDGDIEEYYGSFDNWLVKKNPDGTTGWVKTYGNVGPEEGGEIIPTSDGGYLYATSGYNYLPGNTYCEGHDGQMAQAWLIKLDANGEKEWHRCYGGSKNDLLGDCIELDDGYIIVGATSSADGDINNFHGIPGESKDLWVFKTNLSGDIIWSNCFGGSKDDGSSWISENENGSFTIFGSTKSIDGDVQGNTNEYENNVVWMLTIDADGNLIYQKPFGELNALGFVDFAKKSDYKYLAAVSRRNSSDNCYYTPGNNDNNDIFVFEIQDMDEFIPAQPEGADRVCLANTTQNYYSTQLVVDTMETQWLLIPEEAGTLTQLHDSVLIQWNTNFADTAWLQVRAINEYGESNYSEAKEIIIYPPLNLSEINGPDSVCTANNQQSLFTTQLINEMTLSWYLEPETSGEIINLQDTALINWNPAYEGMVSLKTAATNPCEEEEYSPQKEIWVKTCLGLKEHSYAKLKIYPNPAKTQITFELPTVSKASNLHIKDIFGNTIEELAIAKGQTQLIWDCSRVSSGVYFYHCEIEERIYRGKLVVN